MRQLADSQCAVFSLMPIGFVCQLYYAGGGSLLCQTSTGDSWQLPFAYASPHVRIGHTVSFSLAPDGASLAVDLEVIQEKTSTSSVCAEKRQRSIQEKAAKPVVASQTTTFQEAATKYHQVSQRRSGRKASDA